ncbi:MAG: dTDP-glucose 4,6-dehydratase [Clostridia bacterium]|nr:dTDP-glucose 4,6-dehydratase [Clostridia bacterium]
MEKYLITGGLGFIGYNYLLNFTKKDCEYVCLDKVTYAANIDQLPRLLEKGNIRFIKEDITNRDAIFKLFKNEKFDYVINFAAESHVDNSIINPYIFAESNYIGAMVLMDASVKFGIKRFHQISTDEVYGDSQKDTQIIQFNESDALHPSSPYSVSKAATDMYALSMHRTYNLPITISRCSNNYGPFQFKEKLIPKIIYNAKNNKNIPIYGDGLNMRNWINVKDHCKAINLIFDKGKDGEIYNVTGNDFLSNIELAKRVLKILNKPESLIEYIPDRLGHDFCYVIDDLKIRELGFNNDFCLLEDLEKLVDWYITY